MPGGRIDLFGQTPGLTTAQEGIARAIAWGKEEQWVIVPAIIDGTARDVGNTPTTVLRAGLLLGNIAASGEKKEYNPNGTDGSDVVFGALIQEYRMQDLDANNVDRFAYVMVGGPVQAAKLILLDQQARAQMQGRFLFDDDFAGNFAGWQRVVAKTGNYTVLASDNNTIFTNQGAAGPVTFTLPTIAKGLRYRFFAEVAQNLIVQSVVTDTLVVFNDAAADSIAFQTAAEIIGGGIEVFANADATKWLVWVSLGAETQTPTIVT